MEAQIAYIKSAVRGLVCLLTFLTNTVTTVAAQEVDLDTLGNEAVSLLQKYLQIDTINPPGNEVRAVEFLASILSAEGIPFETAESAPGRANIWARLEGGEEPGLLLLHHSDVVPADETYWEVPPLSGEIRDGYVYGRGALDMKSAGILHLQTFLALHRAGRPLRRDVIFMATADEEAGGLYGAGWLVKNRPELFKHVGLLLNEGGGGIFVGGRETFNIEVTQKVPLWLRLVATGKPGHGSGPRTTSAVSRLLRALSSFQNYEFPARIIPAVDAYFKGVAEHQEGDLKAAFMNMAEAVQDPEFLLKLQLDNPWLHALTRDTCAITRLEGSNKINVIPPKASAEIDCRLLPDQDPDAFVEQVRATINDPSISIEVLLSFAPAVSPTDTELYEAITAVITDHYPQATIVPGVLQAFTDSHFFRDLGIVSYGFIPRLIPLEDIAGVHGNNERVSVKNMKQGVRSLLEIVQKVVY